MVADGAKRLPDGWEWSTLGALTENFDGKRVPVKSSDRESMSGEYPYYGASGVIDHVNDYLFDGDFLLIAEDGANLLSRSTPIAFQAHRKFWVNNHAHIVKTRNGMPLGFLEHYLNSLDLKFYVTGTAQPKLTQANLNKIPVPLPPLPEQEWIVSRIEELFSDLEAGVAALERVRAGLRRYKASVLKAAVEGKLVEQNADEEPAGELLRRILIKRKKKAFEPEIENLPTLPNGWVWTTADQLSESERSITYGVVKLGNEVDDGVPTLRSSNVRHLLLETDVVKSISPNIASQYKRTKLEGGEILITVRGTLGGVVVAPEEVAGWNISREVAMIALIDKQIGSLLQYFIASVPLQNWLSRHTRGIAYTGINIETLKQLPIPLPPLDEQRRIVAEVERRLSVVGEVESAVKTGLLRAGRLRQSVLRSAFEGRL